MGYFGARYIPKYTKNSLLTYRYNVTDKSLFYYYVTKYYFSYVIQFVPYWIAPNMITLFGFAFATYGFVTVMLNSPTLTEQIPPYVSQIWSFCFIVYATLDALDGKQARRTGTSSPLGLLFDHGCDCLNLNMVILVLCAHLQTGWNWIVVYSWVIGTVGFFFIVLEEYYTKCLYMSFINGATEGVLTSFFIVILTSFQESTDPIFLRPSILGTKDHQRNVDFFIVFLGMGIIAMFGNIYNIITKISTVKRSSEHKGSQFSYIIAYTRCLPLIGTVIFAIFWSFCSPSLIFQRSGLVYTLTFTLLMSRQTICLMIAHLTDEHFHPFNKTMASFLILACYFIVLLNSHEKFHINTIKWMEDKILLELLVLASFSLIHLIYFVCRDMSLLLNINLFTLTRRQLNFLKKKRV